MTTAKQWAARAAMAVTMAAGLSACGGGGDSATPATTPTVTPEVLTAGLTIKESTDTDFQPAVYAEMKIIDVGTDYDTDTEYGRYAENNIPGAPNHIELLVQFSKTTGQVTRATLVKDPHNAPWHAMGCGFDGFACDNSHISFNPSTNEIRVTSMGLKSLSFTTTRSNGILFDDNTHLATNPGTAVISGIVTLK